MQDSRASRPSHAPAPEGLRRDWGIIPKRIREGAERWLGSAIVNVESQPTGFSPGVAVRIRTSSGARAFIKAVGPDPNADAPPMHRREAQVVAAMPTGVPVPRLLWSYDDDSSGWVVLVFEDIEGWHPAHPWRLDELDRVTRAMTDLATALTPSPLPRSMVGTASDEFRDRICGWRRIREEQPSRVERLDPWSSRNLETLVEYEAEAERLVVGDTLLHLDVRADNILLAPDKVWFVDWPSACVGAAWVDIAFFAPSVTMQGGPSPEQVIARHPAARTAEPNAITAAAVAIAGFFTHRSLQPAPPGLPTVRAFQAAQGVVAREWVARCTGWS